MFSPAQCATFVITAQPALACGARMPAPLLPSLPLLTGCLA